MNFIFGHIVKNHAHMSRGPKYCIFVLKTREIKILAFDHKNASGLKTTHSNSKDAEQENLANQAGNCGKFNEKLSVNSAMQWV